MNPPSATYRLQFNSSFTFADARDLVPYLRDLGISHVYCSPIFEATPDSTHGYDVTDPTNISSSLGGRRAFDEFVGELRRHGLGLILDIVPNHMAANAHNRWWLDVLENGASSPYEAVFDLRWSGDGESARIDLPVLGDLYGRTLESGDLALSVDEDGFYVSYFEHRLPIDPSTYALVLDHCYPANVMPEAAIAGLSQTASELPARSETAPRKVQQRRDGGAAIKAALQTIYETSDETRSAIDRAISAFAGEQGRPESFDLLDGLLSRQVYRLTHWRTATERTGYRRFFDVNGLVGVRAEDLDVFALTHALVLDLVRNGQVDGLRVDHVDGLRDPERYLEMLRQAVTLAGHPGLWIVVEKILARDEALPPWPVQGTTGYEFIDAAEPIFVNTDGANDLEVAYRRFTGSEATFDQVAYECKKLVIDQLFQGELKQLLARLASLAESDRHARDLSPSQMESALIEVTACLAQYRTYGSARGMPGAGLAALEAAFESARGRARDIEPAVFDFLESRLSLKPLPRQDAGREAARLSFVQRWQQFTAPVTAKGIEDTALYRYTALISRNEVGSHPHRQVDDPLAVFHRWASLRAAESALSLNATTTHDTKRSEDVRARLHALSEVAAEFAALANTWREVNAPLRTRIGATEYPTLDEEWYIYQTLLGSWPLDIDETPAYEERLKSHLVKAMREAKLSTSWLAVHQEREGAAVAFLQAILVSAPFRATFDPFQRRIAQAGQINSLSLTTLRLTAPGIPDTYRGAETWDFSLTDPDNRRPVNFAARKKLLSGQEVGVPLPHALRDGRAKLHLLHRLLRLRRELPALFLHGGYLPLEAGGPMSRHTVAFARRHGQRWALICVPRLMAGPTAPAPADAWSGTSIRLPAGAPDAWTNRMTGRPQSLQQGALDLCEAFRDFPVAVLVDAPLP